MKYIAMSILKLAHGSFLLMFTSCKQTMQTNKLQAINGTTSNSNQL